jgi:phospholipid-binding lipoprotein MlaA
MDPRRSCALLLAGAGVLLTAGVSAQTSTAAAAPTAVQADVAAAAPRDPRDPWESYNRQMSRFNDQLDTQVLKPVSLAYQRGVPGFVRTGVNNFFSNLGDAWSLVNNVLQAKGVATFDTVVRLSVNTVLGFGGVIDLASEMGIPRHKEDFGQTLGRWGVHSGPYLVLPMLGPSTVRDAFGRTLDMSFGEPVNKVRPDHAQTELFGLQLVSRRAGLLRASALLDEVALDKYSFTRDAYLQARAAEIKDGSGGDDDPPSAPDSADLAPEPDSADPAP